MRALWKKAEKFFYEKDAGRWVLSTLLIVFLYGILFQCSVIRFGTNDDNTIINSIIYAAEHTGTEFSGFMYINFFLGSFLAFFYRNFGNVPWYDLYSVAVLIFSGIVIFKSILKIGYKTGKKPQEMICLLFILFWILFAVIFQQVQFTTTASIAGTAALVNFLCAEQEGKGRIVDFLISWLLFHMCMFQREMVGYIILAFFILIIGVDVVKCFYQYRSLRKMKGILLFVLITFSTLLMTNICGKQLNGAYSESKEFQEYSSLRVRYMDYNVDAYQTNPEVFEEMGWDETLCIMVKNWYFMDKRYNVDTLRKILEVVDHPENENENSVSLAKAKTVWSDLIKNERIAVFELILLIGVIIVAIAQYLINKIKKNHWRALTMAGSWAGCALMYVYLSFSGRLPLRVFESIMLPTIVLTIILVLQISEKPIKPGIKALTAVFFLMIMTGVVGEMFDKRVQESYCQERDRLIAMKEFCSEHENNVYIYDNTLTGGEPIFYRTANNTVHNCFFWGGTSMFSQSYYASLERNGLQELHSEDWFRDNVYYLTQDEEMIYILNGYLSGLFEDVNHEIVERIGNIQVTKFTNIG